MNRNLPEPLPFGRGITPATANDGSIEFGTLVAALRRNKWLILLSVAACAGTASMVLRTVQPGYDSYAEVLLESRQERVTGAEQVVSDLLVNNSVVAGEIAVLRSNLLLGRVVDKLNLIEHPEFDPYRISEPGPLKQLLEVVTARVNAWRGIEVEPRPDVEVDGGGLSPEDARNLVIWQVKRNLNAAQSGIAYVIGISVQAGDPDAAAAIANGVAEQYITDQLDTKYAATQRAIVWLDNRLAELETQLRSAEDAVVDFLAEQSLGEGGNEDSVSQQLAEMNKAFVLARADRDQAASRLANVKRLAAEGGHETAVVALDSLRLAALDQERALLERQRAQLAMRLGPRHPEMMGLTSAIEDLTRDRAAAIDAGIGEIESALVLAEGRARSLEENIVAAHGRLIEISRESVRLRQLERSASAMRQVYESFLSRFQETTQQLEFQRADARIITEGEPALSPSRPRKKLILAVAIVVGGVLGVAASLLYEVMNRTVRNASDLIRVTRLPVLGALPKVRRRSGGVEWQLAELRRAKLSPYAEGLRLLRAALMNTRTGAPPRVLLFTGAQPGAGTSSAALGLARVIDAVGTSVVIVDANLRKPALHSLFGFEPAGPGLVDLIEGRAKLEDVIVFDPESGVAALPAWHSRQNAADLVSSMVFRKMLEILSEQFDVVILDAPPAVGFADAKVLAGLADTTIVVARAGASREGSIAAAIAAIEEAGGIVSGTVLSHAARPGSWANSQGYTADVFQPAAG